eukprot:TRINITY_DN74208_c0_g1_i1.p1 TRINITY_DN74208_c0_g1~~TRINITY_DN74208_c0_g1_i1.p1  ORF type:complete len:562 (-),score=92.26 TRINITY_DN74208_c0_g1_i1:52-1737(-)
MAGLCGHSSEYQVHLDRLIDETALVRGDVDRKTKALFDTLHERRRMKEACDYLRQVLYRMPRDNVDNWSAYIYTLLKHFDPEAYDSMKSQNVERFEEARNTLDDVNSRLKGLQPTASTEEMRVDPQDSKQYTYAQLQRKYSTSFGLDEIKAYWNEDCMPFDVHAIVTGHSTVRSTASEAKAITASRPVPPPERRLDPEDGVARTKEEVKQKYKGIYTYAEIDAYFLNDCTPVTNDKANLSAGRTPPPASPAITSIVPQRPSVGPFSDDQPSASTSSARNVESTAVASLLPGPLEARVRTALTETELEGDPLEAALALVRELYNPLVQTGLEGRVVEVAVWCRITFTKKLADVVSKAQRLGDYLELEDGETQRLRDAVAACANSVSSSPSSHCDSERRIDPQDGAALTKDQLRRRYAGQYGDAEVEAYWRDDCRPSPRLVPAHKSDTGVTPSPKATSTARALGNVAASTVSSASAVTLPVSAASTTTSGVCKVHGLEEWLQSLRLEKYTAQATEWCVEMGAISLSEVRDNLEDFASALQLKPLERRRLEAGASGAPPRFAAK